MPGRHTSSSKMPVSKRRKKQGGSSAPLLPPPVADEDVVISDEDVEFVRENLDYAGFLANLDTKPINRQVLGLKPGRDGDDLETKYEKGSRRENHITDQLSVEPVDVLPVKTLAGELRYRSTSNADPDGSASSSSKERQALLRKIKDLQQPAGDTIAQGISNDELEEKHKKSSKAEKRREAKFLKRKHEQILESNQEQTNEEETTLPPVVQTELERGVSLKARMAEIAVTLLGDPTGNIMTLKELQDMCTDRDESVSQLAMLSSLAIFKDLIPGYRVRLPTEKEMEMAVSKEVRILRDYETALLRFYQVYVQMLIKSAKARSMRWTALRCLCGLLEAVPHFNYRESILSAIVPRMGSEDDDCCHMCCVAVSSLFKSPGKHGNDATVEAVQLIADFVRLRNCQLRPEVIQVFLGLSFDEDLVKNTALEDLEKHPMPAPKLSNREAKKEKKTKKKQLALRLRKEVQEDFKEASALPSVLAHRKSQMLTLSSLFETYFRILKTSLEPKRKAMTPEETMANSTKWPLQSRPLLGSCLEGLAKFSHLINVDFMADLLNVLQALARGGKGEALSSEETCSGTISVWERLQCCTVAFKIVRLNMDALNIDLREFYTLFYNLLPDTVFIRGEGGKKCAELLAQALQTMLWEGTHNDMRRVAAFVKRLSTLALHLTSAEACIAVLATVQQLLVRYKKCRVMLENVPGPSPVSTSPTNIASADQDPDLSDALSTSLWELTLLAQHPNPEVAKYASTIAGMSSSKIAAMPTVMPMAAVTKGFSSLYPFFVAGAHAPSKSKRSKRHSWAQRQVASPFLENLEEEVGLPAGLDERHSSAEDIKRIQTLLGRHFRLIKACAGDHSIRRPRKSPNKVGLKDKFRI